MVYKRGTMKNLTIAFLAAAALTSFGCKKKGGGGDMMGKMTELKDAMCKCTDKACADKVQADMTKWSTENAKTAGDKAEKPDEKTMAEMTKVGEQYGTCMAKAMTGGAPAGGEAAKPAEPPPAAKVACVDGAYKDPTNTYCVKAPEGFTPPKQTRKDSDTKSVDQFDAEGNNTFMITIYTGGMKFDDMKTNLSGDANGSKVAEKGDFDGGGFFVKSHNDAEKETGFSSVVQSGNKVIVCESLASDDKALNPADACKTLRAL